MGRGAARGPQQETLTAALIWSAARSESTARSVAAFCAIVARSAVPEQDVTAQPENQMMLTFRCPRELEGLLAPPVPAAQGMPDWFKAMPPQAFNAVSSRT